MTGATRALAEFVVDCRDADLPEAVATAAGRSLADTLAAVAAGAGTEPARGVQAAARRYGDGEIPAPGGTSLAPPGAALTLGTAAHALELDDGHRRASAHPGAVVVPAALVVGERTGADGEALTAAMVAGYEATVAAAAAVMPSHRERGFHATATAGCLGAAATAASLLDLDVGATVDALGLGGTQAGGLFEFLADGSMAKRVHPGRAAMAGVLAADMADTGVTGPGSVVEGEDGFAAAFADDADLSTFEQLGSPYAITETYRKPYACCRHVHGPIDAALRAREQLDPGSVDSVLVETYPTAAHHDATSVDTQLDAQMSIPYGVAAALLNGRPDLAAFDPDGATDRLFALAERVSVEATDEMAARYPDERPSRTVVRGGGREIVHDVPYPTGAAEEPMSVATLREKYDTLTGNVPDDVADRAFDAALDLPTAGGPEPFFDLVAAADGPE